MFRFSNEYPWIAFNQLRRFRNTLPEPLRARIANGDSENGTFANGRGLCVQLYGANIEEVHYVMWWTRNRRLQGEGTALVLHRLSMEKCYLRSGR